jgi:D-sedoheptulose 7-phosphate isomerase
MTCYGSNPDDDAPARLRRAPRRPPRTPRRTAPPRPGGRFLRERGALNSEALTVNTSALTAIANDMGFENVFVRQIEAFAQPGDVVVGITTSGTSRNIVRALEAAKHAGATTVAFTGNGGGDVAKIADLTLLGPTGYSAIVQEVHITMGHIICDLVEQELLFG